MINLNTCLPGDKLLSCHGMTLIYLGKTEEGDYYDHYVMYPPYYGGIGSRMNDGFVYKNESKRLPVDHDIVQIIKRDQSAYPGFIFPKGKDCIHMTAEMKQNIWVLFGGDAPVEWGKKLRESIDAEILQEVACEAANPVNKYAGKSIIEDFVSFPRDLPNQKGTLVTKLEGGDNKGKFSEEDIKELAKALREVLESMEGGYPALMDWVSYKNSDWKKGREED